MTIEKMELVRLLERMAGAVRQNSSFEGNVSYTGMMEHLGPHEFEVIGRYGVDGSRKGHMGMRLIGHPLAGCDWPAIGPQWQPIEAWDHATSKFPFWATDGKTLGRVNDTRGDKTHGQFVSDQDRTFEENITHFCPMVMPPPIPQRDAS